MVTHTEQLFSAGYAHQLACTHTVLNDMLSHPATCHREGRLIHACGDAQLIEVHLFNVQQGYGARPSGSIEWILLKKLTTVHYSTITSASKLMVLYLEEDLRILSQGGSRWFKCIWQVLWRSRYFLPLDCHSCVMNLHTPPQSAQSPLSSHLSPIPLMSSNFQKHLFALIPPLLAPVLSHLHIRWSHSRGELSQWSFGGVTEKQKHLQEITLNCSPDYSTYSICPSKFDDSQCNHCNI